MERLTYEIIDGGIVVDKEEIKEFEIEDGITVYGGNAILRLAEYEYTDLTPGQIREIDKLYAEKCRELEELKKNHGFPCAVGDIVYRVSLNDVKEYKVFAINIGIRENASSCVILTKNNRDAVIGFETIDFGKTVFLTRKEAESKLAEMEGGHE